MPQNKRHLRILGINPGWRYLAAAVFDNSDLREWRLKGLDAKGASAKRGKVYKILSALIDRYRPNVLAIKKLHPSRCSSNLKRLTEEIKIYCARKDMKIFSYSLRDLESSLLPEGKINKKKLAEALAAEYPALIYELGLERKHTQPYHIRLFEAVAAGLLCYRQNN
jgi:Holliday junction resolvasome RuvABC endonuclease subunit